MGALWLLILAPGASFLVGLYLGSWYLRREVRELQYGLADLEDRLLREVKRRAATMRWDAEGEPAKLKDELESHLKGTGFLTPGEFVRKKWGGRHGSQPQ